MNASAKHTLLVPTHNRPGMLATLLDELARAKLSTIVLDSSKPDARAFNARAVRAHSNVQHQTFAEDIYPFDKWLAGIRMVQTPYMSFLADDDFLYPDVLARCIDVLDSTPRAAAVQGLCLHFDPNPAENGTLPRVMLENFGESIVADHAGGRLVQLLTNFESPIYAVYRTAVQRETFQRLSRLGPSMYHELYQGTATALKGDIIRLPEVYMARRACPKCALPDRVPGRLVHHPGPWIALQGSECFEAYLPYRRELLDLWSTCEEHLSAADRQNWCDVAHYLYLHRDATPDYVFAYRPDLREHDRRHKCTRPPEVREQLRDKVVRLVYKEQLWRRPGSLCVRAFGKAARVLGLSRPPHAALPDDADRIFYAETDYPIGCQVGILPWMKVPHFRQAIDTIREFMRKCGPHARAAA